MSGNKLAAARQELTLAARSIDRMKAATDLDEFDPNGKIL
ncbi:hypothetical protein ABH945_003016 [Paraburkholderia sp. GAS333]